METNLFIPRTDIIQSLMTSNNPEGDEWIQRTPAWEDLQCKAARTLETRGIMLTHLNFVYMSNNSSRHCCSIKIVIIMMFLIILIIIIYCSSLFIWSTYWMELDVVWIFLHKETEHWVLSVEEEELVFARELVHNLCVWVFVFTTDSAACFLM